MFVKKLLNELTPALDGVPEFAIKLKEAEERLVVSLLRAGKFQGEELKDAVRDIILDVSTILMLERLMGVKGRMKSVTALVANELTISEMLRLLRALRTIAKDIDVDAQSELAANLEAVLIPNGMSDIWVHHLKINLRALTASDWRWLLFQVAKLLLLVGRLKGPVGYVAALLATAIHRLTK